MVNWTEITETYPNFTSELQKKWETKGFSAEETKKWMEFGLKPKEANFADWLKKKYNIAAEDFLGDDDMEELRGRYKKESEEGSEEVKKDETQNIQEYSQERLEIALEKLKKQPQLSEEIPSELIKIDNEISEIEKKFQILKESLDSDQAELVERFINANKRIIKNEEDDQARSELGESHKALEEKILSKEKVEEIIRHCEKLVDLEWQKESLNSLNNILRGEFQTATEFPPKK